MVISIYQLMNISYIYFSAIMNTVTMNIYGQILVWTLFFNYLEYKPRSRITGSCDNSYHQLPFSTAGAPFL